MTSELRVNTLKDASGNNSVGMSTVSNGSAKSYTQFAGDGTATINESFNTSTLLDEGSGLYKLTVTSAMNSSNYAVVLHSINDVSYPAHVGSYDYDRTTTQFTVKSSNSGSAWADSATLDSLIHGDLA